MNPFTLTIITLPTLCLFALALPHPAQAQQSTPTLTRRAGVNTLQDLKQYATLPHFRLGGTYTLGEAERYADGGEGGTPLEALGTKPLRVSYIATGTPRYNAQGGITNAVIINSYYSGDASFMYHYWYQGQAGNRFAEGAVVGPGALIDTQKYYVVFLDSVGLWGASKPSDGLGIKFPQYTVFDMVQANYRLLKDHLHIDQVVLAMGPSMGAIQSYVWPLLHPGYVKGILPIGGSVNTAQDPIVRPLYQLMTAAIQSDPVWRQTQGDYYHLPKSQHPNQGVEFGWSLLGLTGTSLDYQYAQGWDVKKKNTFSWSDADLGSDLKQRAADYDANDLLYRNQALFAFDIRPYMSRIQSKTLILHINNDQWLRPQNAQWAHQHLPGSQLLSFEDPLAHYAIFKAPHQFAPAIRAFLKDLD